MQEPTKITVPLHMRHLPLHHGIPVPRFVAKVHGKYDFRIITSGHLVDCVKQGTCYICGLQLGSYKAFCIGPQGFINGISPEPPCHLVCAEYAVRVCPFMLHPERGHTVSPSDASNTVSYARTGSDKTNPGVFVLYTTRAVTWFVPPSRNGILFELGEPTSVAWWTQGRLATRQEALAALQTAIAKLDTHCETDADHRALGDAVDRRVVWLPEA